MTKPPLLTPHEAWTISIGAAAYMLSQAHHVDYVHRGNDMLPIIRGGKDRVSLTPYFHRLRTGDIVLANVSRSYVLLRILEIRGDRIVLLGDALPVENKVECSMSDILGRVNYIRRGRVGFHPKGGNLWMSLLPLRKSLMRVYKVVRKSNLDTIEEGAYADE